MSFRDDLDAARERVRALERDVAAARARNQQNRAHVAQLKLSLTGERLRENPPPPPRPRSRYGFRRDVPYLIAFVVIMAGLGIAVLVSPASPEDVGGSRYAIDLFTYMKRRLPPGAQIVSIDAQLVDRSGQVHVHRDTRLKIEYVAPGNCGRIEWRADPKLSWYSIAEPCGEAPSRVVHCSPFAVRERLSKLDPEFGEYAALIWDGGVWSARKWNGPEWITLEDNCERQLWP